MKHFSYIIWVFCLFNLISTAVSKEISLTHVMTYVLQWNEKEVGLVNLEQFGRCRRVQKVKLLVRLQIGIME